MSDRVVAGVDVAAARPCTLVLMRGLRAIDWLETGSVRTAADWLVDRRPDVIAIDAPCGLSRGLLVSGVRGFRPYRGRVCDRELMKRAISLYQVPRNRADVDPWMEIGLQLYDALGECGYNIPQIASVPRSTIEIYPYGSFTTLLRKRPLKKKSKEGVAQRVALLRDQGVQWDGHGDHDSLDALAGALTGLRYLEGLASAVGDSTEALIWLPVVELQTSYYSRAADVSQG